MSSPTAFSLLMAVFLGLCSVAHPVRVPDGEVPSNFAAFAQDELVYGFARVAHRGGICGDFSSHVTTQETPGYSVAANRRWREPADPSGDVA